MRITSFTRGTRRKPWWSAGVPLSHKQNRFVVHHGPERTLRQRILAAKARVSRQGGVRGGADEIDGDADDQPG
jgi:hypothetical protein